MPEEITMEFQGNSLLQTPGFLQLWLKKTKIVKARGLARYLYHIHTNDYDTKTDQ